MKSFWQGSNGKFELLSFVTLSKEGAGVYRAFSRGREEFYDHILAEMIGDLDPFVRAVELQEDVVPEKVQWLLRSHDTWQSHG